MSANNFENNVQQKLDELRLVPTDQVWLEVERRIREKKRRRIIFWFLLPGFLLLAGGTWWIMNQPGEKNNTATTELNQNNKTEKEIINDSTGKSKLEQEDDAIKNTDGNKKTELPVNTKTNTTKESFNETKINKPTAKPETLPADKKAIVKKQGTTSEILNQFPVSKTDVTHIDKTTDTKADIVKTNDPVKTTDIDTQVTNNLPDKKADAKNIVADTLVTTKTEEIKTAETKNTVPVDLISDNLPKTDSTATVTKKNKQKKTKWETGITASIGTSKLTNKGLIGFGMKSNDLLFSSPASGSGRFNSSYADSIPLKGLAWQLGGYAKRNWGKKTSYSIGLNLSYYSTNQNVGAFVDSVRTINNGARSVTTAGFYRNGNSNNYRNKYYYFQVPLLLHWQINKGKGLPPLIWENGFSPSFMIGSKALVYDKPANLFFRDKKLYNKFSLVYHTAIDVKLFSGKNHPLTAGLFYDFHFGMLQKISPPHYNYLKSFGIKINYTLKK